MKLALALKTVEVAVGRALIVKREQTMCSERTPFRIYGNNKGLACPFKPIVCPEGLCLQCPIYLDWQKREEKIVICARCGKVMRRIPDSSRSVLLHGLCDECT